MKIAQIKKQVANILNNHFNEIQFKTDSDNLIECGLDSIKTIQLVLRIEESFGIEFANEDLLLVNFSSIESIARLIEQYQ